MVLHNHFVHGGIICRSYIPKKRTCTLSWCAFCILVSMDSWGYLYSSGLFSGTDAIVLGFVSVPLKRSWRIWVNFPGRKKKQENTAICALFLGHIYQYCGYVCLGISRCLPTFTFFFIMNGRFGIINDAESAYPGDDVDRSSFLRISGMWNLLRWWTVLWKQIVISFFSLFHLKSFAFW